MHVLPRRLVVGITGIATAGALAVPMAGQASAATTTVKIESDATGSQRLNRLGDAVPG
ncbi:MAG TPA: hypothetical protein VN213_07765 [Solirubrobacteraceae bacterium]|nr:hypothetical protein [Solirubrobacteraceae bacterium]